MNRAQGEATAFGLGLSAYRERRLIMMLGLARKKKQEKRPLNMAIFKRLIDVNVEEGVSKEYMYHEMLIDLLTYVRPEGDHCACRNIFNSWIREILQERAEQKQQEIEHEMEELGFDDVGEYEEYLKEIYGEDFTL